MAELTGLLVHHHHLTGKHFFILKDLRFHIYK